MYNNKYLIISICCTTLSFSIGFLYSIYENKKKEYMDDITTLENENINLIKIHNLSIDKLKNVQEELKYMDTLIGNYEKLKIKYNNLEYDYNDIQEKLFKLSIEHENEINKLKEYYSQYETYKNIE